MTAVVIDGKAVAQTIRDSVQKRVAALTEKGIKPGLAVVIVGDDPASHTYVKNKQKTCEKLGMRSDLYQYPSDLPEAELLRTVEKLNADPGIHGILVQLPLPGHISEMTVIEAIDPAKDVDGFHPVNAGKLLIGEEGFIPCTPHGVMKLLDHYGIDAAGKHAVIIGRSNIVGKPAALLLLEKNATVTVCHSKTADLAAITKQADIVVAAVGRPNYIGAQHIKPGAVVIDVGINRNSEGKLCGDVNFTEVSEVASYITPVPGGVGPMTIAMLMENTVHSAEMGLDKDKPAGTV